MKFIVDRFLLLPIGAAIALVWANTAGESYFRFAHLLAFPVNQIAMAFFLGLIAQETLDALQPGGALHSLRRWSVPVVAAAGGVAGSVLTYLAYVNVEHELVLVQAWPVVCAVDIAAVYYLVKFLLPRSAAVPFVLVVAIVSDLLGFLAVSLGRLQLLPMHPAGPLLVIAAVSVAAVMRSRHIRGFWTYLLPCGAISWAGFYLAGFPPAFALIPIVPFLPHEARRSVFADPPDDDAVHHYEHEWNEVVQVIVFFFGLVNAGVLLTGQDTGTWAVLTAYVVGRPLGILAATGCAIAAGLRLPSRMRWRHLVVVAFATSSSFTFGLFFVSTMLPPGGVLAQIKIGALLSIVGGAIALFVARLVLDRPLHSHHHRVFASSSRY